MDQNYHKKQVYIYCTQKAKLQVVDVLVLLQEYQYNLYKYKYMSQYYRSGGKESQLSNVRSRQQSTEPLLQKDISEMTQNINNLSAINEQLARDAKIAKAQEDQANQKLKSLKQTLKNLRQKDEQIKVQINQHQADLVLYKKELRSLKQNNIKQRVKQNQLKLTTDSAASSEIKKLEAKIKQKQFQLSQHQKELHKITGETKGYEFQISNRNSKLLQAKQRYMRMDQETKRQTSQLQSQKKIMNQLVQKEKSILAELQNQKSLLYSQEAQIEKLTFLLIQEKEKYKIAQERAHNIKNAPASNKSNGVTFFAGDVLQGQDSGKQFLCQVLQKKIGKQIAGTKLIYRYDELNKVNFHKYIDNNEQLVVLVKLINGYILGGWTEGSFYPKMISEKDGLIISISSKSFFELREKNRRAIAYDDFFLIIGNSEIRLKTQDKKLFSNFGVSNSFYNNRGEKVDTLLGSGTTREVELQMLQVFQLKFK